MILPDLLSRENHIDYYGDARQANIEVIDVTMPGQTLDHVRSTTREGKPERLSCKDRSSSHRCKGHPSRSDTALVKEQTS
jgi:hypothetical protein